MSYPADFGEVPLQAIDDALLVPGEIVRTAVYDRVQRTYQIRREEVPEKLELFHTALQDLQPGPGGDVLERLIARNLYCRLGVDFIGHESFMFLDNVDHARKDRK